MTDTSVERIYGNGETFAANTCWACKHPAHGLGSTARGYGESGCEDCFCTIDSLIVKTSTTKVDKTSIYDALAAAHGEWLIEAMDREFTPAEQQLHNAILATFTPLFKAERVEWWKVPIIDD